MKRGRPVFSEVRQNMIEILAVMGKGYGYDIYKHYINLIPGKSYKFTYKFKAPMGSRGQVGIYDLDYSVYDDDRTTKGYFLVKPIKQGDGTWQEASGVFTVPFFDK